MTVQIKEVIHYQGQSHRLLDQPLECYFELGGARPEFNVNCSALWRGYVGTWEINQNRLYLIGLRGTLKDGTQANLATVFPGYPERVFAHWYSGTLHIPNEGQQDTDLGEVQLQINKGIITQPAIQQNIPAGLDGKGHG